MGWGPEIFRLDGHRMPTASSVNRWEDYTHYPRAILNNIPQFPIKMGAFYVMDPRATEAATILMRQGIEVYKLKEDVALPVASTLKFYGPNYAENWGVTKNRTAYIGVFTTKLPRSHAEIRNNYSAEANLVSLNFISNLNGVPWKPLTDAQMPASQDIPNVNGGGDWMTPLPEHLVAKAGYYVIPTAQKWARYAGFQLEPRSNCGLLFWAHWDPAVGGTPRGDVNITGQFNLDLVKTFDYTAIPASALERVVFTEDQNLKPTNEDGWAPPFIGQDVAELPDTKATVESSIQSASTGKVTVTIKDACLHDGMWLDFFFYEEGADEPFHVFQQVFEAQEPGTYKAVFTYAELVKAGLEPGYIYAVHYSNEAGDIAGYGTFTKGALDFDNPCIVVTPFAEIEKISGNQNKLLISIVEEYASGENAEFKYAFIINNNAAGTYACGPYNVFVDSKGNTQIRECYIVQ